MRRKPSDHWEKSSDHWEKPSDRWEKPPDHWEKPPDHWEKPSDHWEKSSDRWKKSSDHLEKPSYGEKTFQVLVYFIIINTRIHYEKDNVHVIHVPRCNSLGACTKKAQYPGDFW
jgi:hypothetical protein